MMNRTTTHPGDVLKEELGARGISQKKFSEVLSVPRANDGGGSRHQSRTAHQYAGSLQHVCGEAEKGSVGKVD